MQEFENKFAKGIENMERDIKAKRKQLDRMVWILADEMGREEISAASINSVLMNIATFTAEIEAIQTKKRLMAEIISMLQD